MTGHVPEEYGPGHLGELYVPESRGFGRSRLLRIVAEYHQLAGVVGGSKEGR